MTGDNEIQMVTGNRKIRVLVVTSRLILVYSSTKGSLNRRVSNNVTKRNRLFSIIMEGRN